MVIKAYTFRKIRFCTCFCAPKAVHSLQSMKGKKIILFLLATVFSVAASAQRGIYKKKYEELVNFDGHNRYHGFHFAPGLTYMLPPFGEKESEMWRSGDTAMNATLKGKGRLGFYAEAGMYHLLRYSRFFRYLDWSIAFKSLGGAQDYTYATSIESTSTTLANAEGTNAFKYNFLLANVNLNHIWQIGHYSFIQNSIGLNFDYALGKKENNTMPVAQTSSFNKTIFALHYKLGYGFKINAKWFIIPAIETPIVNISPFEKGKSTIGVFNMRYRPLILTIRLAWLRKPNPFKCPPVYGPEGDKSRQEKYQMGR